MVGHPSRQRQSGRLGDYPSRVFSRRSDPPPPPEDPAVAAVEHILDAAAARTLTGPPKREGRLVVEHAVWLCACESTEDAPTWLIYDTVADGIGWRRLGDGLEAADVVEANHLAGGHPSPEGVLAWLRGEAPDPWSGSGADFPEHDFVFEALRDKIRPA
jgi:hypothetical protein